MRAVRAAIVVPSLFALTFKVIGDLQMTVFAVFGAFAMLWVREHLHHLGSHTQTITAPAGRLAQQRRVPWWR